MNFLELKVNPSNPRRIRKEQFEKLKKSIGSFTKMLEVRPIAYDEDGVIWGGNIRFEAIKALGIEMKPEYFKELTGYTLEEKREFAIRDNIELGDWDDDILANEWSDLPLEDWGINTVGWDSEEITEDEAPEVSDEEPESKLGEVYQLGRHRLLCGDSTKIEDVEKLMNGQKADMVFTDPPYKAEMQGAGLAIDKESVKEWSGYGSGSDFDLLDYGNGFHDIMFGVSDNLLYLITYNQVHDVISEAIERKMKHRILPVCKTTAPFPSSSNWSIDMNWGVHLYKKPRGKTNNRSWNMIDKATDTEAKKTVDHPSPYRLDLLCKFVDIASIKNDIVLDPFGGSGSTLIACEQLDRTCYISELDPRYTDVIIKRWEKFTGNKAELVL